MPTAITDPDSNALSGIAIIGQEKGNGKWQYLLNNQSIWQDIDSYDLLLKSTDRIRFFPNEKQGTMASLTYRAWDQTIGQSGDLTNTNISGGTSCFSQYSDRCSIKVSHINDAPVVANNKPLYIYEGQSSPLTSDSLLISDIDNSPDAILLYSETAIKFGCFMLDQNILKAGDLFSQQAINEGRVSYEHYGAEDQNLSYEFKFSDGSSAAKTVIFVIQIIPVNDPPIIATNRRLGIVEGETGKLGRTKPTS